MYPEVVREPSPQVRTYEKTRGTARAKRPDGRSGALRAIPTCRDGPRARQVYIRAFCAAPRELFWVRPDVSGWPPESLESHPDVPGCSSEHLGMHPDGSERKIGARSSGSRPDVRVGEITARRPDVEGSALAASASSAPIAPLA